MISHKLVNYASEINGKLEASIFKQLVSGEPVEARLPYGNPFTMTDYAKLIFNCNELPKDVEQTEAYFRRFLIIPFNVTIPEHEQDKQLAKKIIEAELSGIFNWVLAGLKRLLIKKNFSDSEVVHHARDQYEKESDHELQQTSMCIANAAEQHTSRQYFTNTAIKLANTFVQQATLLAKLQGYGGQKIIVEHVDVHNGGQAVVGVVNTGTPTQEKKK